MIILCNGHAKSGSSFVHQVVESIVEASGFDQDEIRSKYLPESTQPYPPHPHFADFEEGQLQEIWESMPESEVMVVKTHCRLTSDIVELMHEGRVKALYTFRNPRDAAVSLYDAARKERNRSREMLRFSAVSSKWSAICVMANRVDVAMSWLMNDRVLKINYEDISNSSLDVLGEIKQYLNYDLDITPIIRRYLQEKQRIREYNVGVSGRYVSNLSLLEEGWSNIIFKKYDELSTKHEEDDNFLF